jgi:hypothetical protein
MAQPKKSAKPVKRAAGIHGRTNTGIRASGRHDENTVRNEAAMRWLTCQTLLWYATGEKVTYAKLGELLSAEMPWRTRPYDQSITNRIITGERSIRLEDVVAFVKVLKRHGVDVDPGWLAFGKASQCPAPNAELIKKARKMFAEP